MERQYIRYKGESYPSGIYKIKTSLGRKMKAELFNGFWLQYDTEILDDESVTHIKL